MSSSAACVPALGSTAASATASAASPMSSTSSSSSSSSSTAASKAAPKSSVYTKRGDSGTSTLFAANQRIAKSHAIFDLLGAVDEISSFVGVAMAAAARDPKTPEPTAWLRPQCGSIQQWLLEIGAALSAPERFPFDLDGAKTRTLELWIDTLDNELPPLKNFIMPGGAHGAAELHVARSVVRRAERHLTLLVLSGGGGDGGGGGAHGGDVSIEASLSSPQTPHAVLEPIQRFINRLSDYFFVAARAVSEIEDERVWLGRRTMRKSDMGDDSPA